MRKWSSGCLQVNPSQELPLWQYRSRMPVVSLYFLKHKTNLNHQKTKEGSRGLLSCLSEKTTHTHKERLFVSGEFLLQYRAVRPPPPFDHVHPIILTEQGTVGRYGINRLDLVGTPGHKSDLLTTTTPQGSRLADYCMATGRISLRAIGGAWGVSAIKLKHH